MNGRPQSGRENTLTRFPAGSRNIIDRLAAPVVRAAFGPLERAMFRMLGIRQYLLLRRVES